MEIELIKGDITKVTADAIVNAANSSLLGGGGVDGAIHRVGGPEILEDCIKIRNKQGGCKTSEAVITRAGKLDAKHVIHTVGPVYNNGGKVKENQLADCYRNVIELSLEQGLNTIAFPNISTGIYRFPKQLAAEIAVKTIKSYQDNAQLQTVMFVCYDDENYNIYRSLLKDP